MVPTGGLEDVTLGEVYRSMTTGFSSVQNQIGTLELRLRQDYMPRTELDVHLKDIDNRFRSTADDIAAMSIQAATATATRQWSIGQLVTVAGLLTAIVLGVVGFFI